LILEEAVKFDKKKEDEKQLSFSFSPSPHT